MTVIQARPTLYAGTPMRSRLEADYAAHLDSQGYRWAYEPECFASREGQWLPDFGSTFADDRPFAIFTEVKPAGPLQEMPTGLRGEHVDGILTRMTIAWASRPDACLELVFWQYGGPAYLHLIARRHPGPWFALVTVPHVALLWPGMGQAAALSAYLGDRSP